MQNQPDRSGYFELATVYAEPNGFTKEYIFKVPAIFAEKERGNLQSGWNRIIILKGETRTLAEYPEKERVEIWGKGYEAIAKWLINNKK